MQTAIVLLIVAAAAFFLVRRLYQTISRKENPSTCGCGCSGCGDVKSRGQEEAGIQNVCGTGPDRIDL